MPSFRHVFWTLFPKNRHWYMPPVDVVVENDYAILIFNPTKWTREALPIIFVVQNYCKECSLETAAKVYFFWSTMFRTRRVGSDGMVVNGDEYPNSTKRRVRNPASYDMHMSAIVYIRDIIADAVMPGNVSEFEIVVDGSPCYVEGSGIYWDLIGRWLIQGEVNWYSSDDNFDEIFQVTLLVPIVFGDTGTTTVDDPFTCVPVCNLGVTEGEESTTYGPYGLGGTTRVYVGDDGVEYTEVFDPTIIIKRDPDSQFFKDRMAADHRYAPCPVERLPLAPEGKEFFSAICIPGEIKLIGICEDDQVCTISPDHKVIKSYRMIECLNVDGRCPPGGDPGWYAEVCIQIIGSEDQLCKTFFVHGPLGLPSENSAFYASLYSFMANKLLGILTELLGRLIDKLPPNASFIGHLVRFIIDNTNITVSMFFCDGPTTPKLPCPKQRMSQVVNG